MATVKIYKLHVPGQTDEVYVGSTTLTLAKRFQCHIGDAIRGKGCGSAFLFVMYGRNAVKMQLLEVCTEEQRNVREAYWIQQHPTAINVKMPQPPETNCSTPEGKRAYNEAYVAKKKALMHPPDSTPEFSA